MAVSVRPKPTEISFIFSEEINHFIELINLISSQLEQEPFRKLDNHFIQWINENRNTPGFDIKAVDETIRSVMKVMRKMLKTTHSLSNNEAIQNFMNEHKISEEKQVSSTLVEEMASLQLPSRIEGYLYLEFLFILSTNFESASVAKTIRDVARQLFDELTDESERKEENDASSKAGSVCQFVLELDRLQKETHNDARVLQTTRLHQVAWQVGLAIFEKLPQIFNDKKTGMMLKLTRYLDNICEGLKHPETARLKEVSAIEDELEEAEEYEEKKLPTKSARFLGKAKESSDCYYCFWTQTTPRSGIAGSICQFHQVFHEERAIRLKSEEDVLLPAPRVAFV